MFFDRQEAGRKLASKIEETINKEKAVVLGIPRGGVVVASEIASNLGLPLGILVAKKLAAPQDSELAIGAISSSPESLFLNQELVNSLNISKGYLAQEIKLKTTEVKRRWRAYLPDEKLSLVGKEAIIVDDGAATGATMAAAARQARLLGARKVMVATPVVSREALKLLQEEADQVIYEEAPLAFWSVSQFYHHFPQVNDEQVKEALGYNKG
ncbi:MAG: phosphoribosyltransferase [Patescibacteria group bacterium]|jgi:putative phosphoribosyl transferase